LLLEDCHHGGRPRSEPLLATVFELTESSYHEPNRSRRSPLHEQPGAGATLSVTAEAADQDAELTEAICPP
jgi:hypothetical protein